jgi:hypothetical protein
VILSRGCYHRAQREGVGTSVRNRSNAFEEREVKVPSSQGARDIMRSLVTTCFRTVKRGHGKSL